MQQPPTHIAVTIQNANAVLTYLRSQPWAQVNDLIVMLTNSEISPPMNLAAPPAPPNGRDTTTDPPPADPPEATPADA